MAETLEGREWRARLHDVTRRLDDISPSFCAAKWLQVTLHLENGMTHSCHHPPAHKVPLEELALHPDALHNTEHKRQRRLEMIKGIRPDECGHCWKMEDASQHAFSDRHIKSSDEWAVDVLEELPGIARPAPSYIEVSFGNKCQMRCMYCSPEVSSAIWDEFERHGPYPVKEAGFDLGWLTSEGRRPYAAHEHNPYVDAFWKWFPDTVAGLRVLRLTGGEPLLQESTWDLLHRLRTLGHDQLEIDVNSNFMVAGILLDRLADTLVAIKREGRIKRARLYTSVDTAGAGAEYVRHGMNYQKLIANCDRVLQRQPEIAVTIICTHNVLSFPGFADFLKDLLELKRRHIGWLEPVPRVMLDLTYLRSPSFLSSRLAPLEIRREMRSALSWMEGHRESVAAPWGFNAYEMNKMRRMCDWLEQPSSDEEEAAAFERGQDLARFIGEYDRRKQRDFNATFPTLIGFMDGLRATLP
jgi:hypothetical protein